jgi:hypothetical protein
MLPATRMTPAPDCSSGYPGPPGYLTVVHAGSYQRRDLPNLDDRTHVRIVARGSDEYPGWDSNPHVLEGTMAFEAIASDQIPPPGRAAQMLGIQAARAT